MQEDTEDNKPHLCVPTLDGNAHVIPTAVFTKIILGEMKITDMEDWEIIVRTAFSEWLRGLETAAKARVYKAAVDQLAESMAGGAWQDGPRRKTGHGYLACFMDCHMWLPMTRGKSAVKPCLTGLVRLPMDMKADGVWQGTISMSWTRTNQKSGPESSIQTGICRRHGTGPETNVRKCTFGKGARPVTGRSAAHGETKKN